MRPGCHAESNGMEVLHKTVSQAASRLTSVQKKTELSEDLVHDVRSADKGISYMI